MKVLSVLRYAKSDFKMLIKLGTKKKISFCYLPNTSKHFESLWNFHKKKKKEKHNKEHPVVETVF